MVRRFRFLPVTAEVRELIGGIIGLKIVPASKAVDAAHLAMSAIHGIDYLLTWNYAHMANPFVQAKFERLCNTTGVRAPLMVSPETIPQVRLGHSIRRAL